MISNKIDDNSILSSAARDESKPHSTSKRKKESSTGKIVLNPTGFLSTQEWLILRDPWARARLLYPNPVCLLTTWTNHASERFSQNANCMVITWIMCADNSGGILASVNRKRFSALALQEPSAKFTLSIPTHGMESLVLNVGSCSGYLVDKFLPAGFLKAIATPLVHSDSSYPPGVEHEGIVAVIMCDVVRIFESVEEDHMTVMARMTHAIVRKSHWDGKCFGGSPTILSFLGSKRFAECHEVGGIQESLVNVVAEDTS